MHRYTCTECKQRKTCSIRACVGQHCIPICATCLKNNFKRKNRITGAPVKAAVCTCGEPQDGGQFGWFDTADNKTVCNACGNEVNK